MCVCVCNINGGTIFTLDSFPKFLFSVHSFFPCSLVLCFGLPSLLLWWLLLSLLLLLLINAASKLDMTTNQNWRHTQEYTYTLFLLSLSLSSFLCSVCVECATLLLFTFVVVFGKFYMFQLPHPLPNSYIAFVTATRWHRSRTYMPPCDTRLGCVSQLNRNQFLITYRTTERRSVDVVLHPNKRKKDRKIERKARKKGFSAE